MTLFCGKNSLREILSTPAVPSVRQTHMQGPFLPLLSLFPSQVIDQISAYGLHLQSPAHSPCAWAAQCHPQPGAAPQLLRPPQPSPPHGTQLGETWVSVV